MAEHLIYGKSIRDFGAVGDGIADDTAAFRSAFNSGERRISVPYGNYLITEPLELSACFTLECHKRAEITFCGLTAKSGLNDMTLIGGIWKNTNADSPAFSFDTAIFLRFEQLTIHGSIRFKDCENVDIENTKVYGNCCSGIIFEGSCAEFTLRDLSFFDCENGIDMPSDCSICHIHAYELMCDNCGTLMFAENARITDGHFAKLSGHVQNAAVKLCRCELQNTQYSHFHVHDGYLQFEDNHYERFNIRDFVRCEELELTNTTPTLLLIGNVSVFCEGATLDALILSKKFCPGIKSTPARISSAVLSARDYAFSAEVPANERFLLPCGGFHSLMLS